MQCKRLKESYEWAVIPDNLPRKNLVLVTARTILPTVHPKDPNYPIRHISPQELLEASRSLSRRVIGINHIPKGIISEAQTIDANYNPITQALEVLMYLPDYYINRIREGMIKDVSVEYVWREEDHTPEGVYFRGVTFDRVDLLDGLLPGDEGSGKFRLLEAKRLMESGEKKGYLDGEVKVLECSGKCEGCTLTDPLADSESEPKEIRLEEAFAEYKNFADCKAKNADKGDPTAYCGDIYHKCKDSQKECSNEVIKVEEKLVESAKPKEVEHPKPVEKTPEVVVAPTPTTATVTTTVTEPTVVQTPIPPTPEPVVEPAKVVVDPMDIHRATEAALKVELDDKTKKIADLNTALAKMQENAKVSEEAKRKAVKAAEKKAKEDIIEKIEAVLPSGPLMSNWNLGGRILAQQVKKVIYESKSEK